MTDPIHCFILEVKRELETTDLKVRTDATITGEMLAKGLVFLPKGEYDENHLLQSVHELTMALKEKQKEVARLTELNNGHIRDVKALKEKMARDQTVVNEGVLRETKELRDELRQSSSEKAQLRRNLDALEVQRRETRARLDGAEVDNNNLRTELRIRKEDMELLKTALECCRKELRELDKNGVALLQRDIASLTTQKDYERAQRKIAEDLWSKAVEAHQATKDAYVKLRRELEE